MDRNYAVTGYLTHATALVAYNGKDYIAKSPENPKRAGDLVKEVRILKSLQHNFIISPPRYLVERFGLIVGFLLEYHSNGNVRDYTIKQREKGLLDPELFRKWFLQFAIALRYLLKKGVKYENIKPENCVVNDAKELILIDFASHAHSNEYSTRELLKFSIDVPFIDRWTRKPLIIDNHLLPMPANQVKKYRMNGLVQHTRRLWYSLLQGLSGSSARVYRATKLPRKLEMTILTALLSAMRLQVSLRNERKSS